MSSREARGFLAAICSNPEDDTARLVFADWLDEQGNAPRAEFIRAQVKRAALPEWDARRVRLLMRERVLLAAHEAEWRAELPAIRGATWGPFRRGFVAEAIFNTFMAFKVSGPECWAAAPVEAAAVGWPRQRDVAAVPTLRELTVVGNLVAPDDLSRLIDSPVLSTLRTLTVRDAALGPEGVRRLITSPHLRNLTTLRVPHNAIGNTAIYAIVANTTLPNLTELDLSEPDSYGRYAEDPIINAAGAGALAKWPGLARVRALALSGNNLEQPGLRALLHSPHATGLKHLALRGNALTGAAMKEFRDAPAGLQLESLDLGENVLGHVGAGHLARAECLRELKVLHVDRCELGTAAARKLAKAEFFGGLRVLNIGYSNLGRNGLAALLEASPAELHTLGAAGSDLGDAGAAELAKSPASNALLDIDLTWNRLGDKALRSLAASGHLQNLLALKLDDNDEIGKQAATDFAKSALGKRLAVLELPRMPPWGPNDPIPF